MRARRSPASPAGRGATRARDRGAPSARPCARRWASATPRFAVGRVRGAGGHALLRPTCPPELIDPDGDQPCRSRTAPRASSSTRRCAARRCRSCASAAATAWWSTRSLARAGERAARALHRPHRRPADRARRQPVPDRAARGGGRVPPARWRPAADPPVAPGARQDPPPRVLVELAEAGHGRRGARRARSARRSARGSWCRTEDRARALWHAGHGASTRSSSWTSLRRPRADARGRFRSTHWNSGHTRSPDSRLETAGG